MIVYEKEGNLVFSIPEIEESQRDKIERAVISQDGTVDSDLFRFIYKEKCDNSHGAGAVYNLKVERKFQYDGTNKKIIQNGYNFEKKTGYVLNLEDFTVASYKMLYPKITEFLVNGMEINNDNNNEQKRPVFDLYTLIDNFDEKYEEVEYIMKIADSYLGRRILRDYYKDFAMFYYDIYPYLTFNKQYTANIEELKELKILTQELNLSTESIDKVLQFMPNPGKKAQDIKILKLLNKKL